MVNRKSFQIVSMNVSCLVGQRFYLKANTLNTKNYNYGQTDFLFSPGALAFFECTLPPISK